MGNESASFLWTVVRAEVPAKLNSRTECANDRRQTGHTLSSLIEHCVLRKFRHIVYPAVCEKQKDGHTEEELINGLQWSCRRYSVNGVAIHSHSENIPFAGLCVHFYYRKIAPFSESL